MADLRLVFDVCGETGRYLLQKKGFLWWSTIGIEYTTSDAEAAIAAMHKLEEGETK